MKAEQRKALVTNSLAQEIGKVVEGVKKGPSRSSVVYLVLILLAVVGFFSFRYWSRSWEQTESERWVRFDEILFPDQLDAFAKDDKLADKPQARLARFKEARHKLGQGLSDLGANPSRAQESLRAGTDLYEELAKSSSRVDLLNQEALWGAAKGNEALNELDKARDYYKRLADEYSTSALGKDAAKQLARLNSDKGKADLTNLSKALAAPK